MRSKVLILAVVAGLAAILSFGQDWHYAQDESVDVNGRGVIKWYVGYFNVALDPADGAVGVHTLGPTIEEDEIVMQVIFDVYERIYPATSTNALTMNSTGDLLAAGTTLNSVGLKAGVPVDTAGTAVRCTNEWPVAMTISGSAATTGVYKVIIKTYKALPR